ncbi:MAG: FAD-dependent monooxygenase [Natronospirillum sp.]
MSPLRRAFLCATENPAGTPGNVVCSAPQYCYDRSPQSSIVGPFAMQHYDIAILGGGLVGYAFYLALPPALRQRTVLLDAAPPPKAKHERRPPTLDDRGTALNRRSLDLLRQLGVYDAVAPELGLIEHIEVSQVGYWGVTDIAGPAPNGEPMGAVANNRQLGYALWQTAKGLAEPDALRHNTQVTHVQVNREAAELTLADGRSMAVQLLILADGGRSGIAQQLGIAQRQHDYAQTAFTLNLEREQPADGRAYERFSPDGPRALLPLAGRRQTLIWVTPTLQSETAAQWTGADWAEQVTDCFGYDQGRVTAVSAATQYPLTMKTSLELARPRLALLGNSAMTLHPVAGQGFNLHLRALYDLAQSLSFSDPGDSGPLLAWQARTYQENHTVGWSCHSLVGLFSPNHPILSHARGLGLAGFNALNPLKRLLAKRAMGLNL